MEKSSFESLEFSKVLSILSGYAKSAKGRNICINLEPFKKIEDIITSQNETTEAKTYIQKYNNIAFTDTEDIKSAIEKASINSIITTSELLKISYILDVLHNVKESFKNNR